MIDWDSEFKQIMTSLCRSCPDDYFAPYSKQMEHVGCCSYSPIFTLFEIWKMVKSEQVDFFMEQIYNNPCRTLGDYDIVIHAYVHDAYEQSMEGKPLFETEEDDMRIKFSVCQFFKRGKGCGLNPFYKNSVCRSFICSAVEDKLDQASKLQLSQWARQIRTEADGFHEQYKKLFKEKGWSLRSHVTEILEYFRSV